MRRWASPINGYRRLAKTLMNPRVQGSGSDNTIDGFHATTGASDWSYGFRRSGTTAIFTPHLRYRLAREPTGACRVRIVALGKLCRLPAGIFLRAPPSWVRHWHSAGQTRSPPDTRPSRRCWFGTACARRWSTHAPAISRRREHSPMPTCRRTCRPARILFREAPCRADARPRAVPTRSWPQNPDARRAAACGRR